MLDRTRCGCRNMTSNNEYLLTPQYSIEHARETIYPLNIYMFPWGNPFFRHFVLLCTVLTDYFHCHFCSNILLSVRALEYIQAHPYVEKPAVGRA